MENHQIISALSDKAHEDFRQEVRAFVRKQIAPYAGSPLGRKTFF